MPKAGIKWVVATALVWVLLKADGIADGPISQGNSSPSGSTFVRAADSLKNVTAGRQPKSKEELVELEEQIRRVAKLAMNCTLGVRIGNAQGSGVIVRKEGYVLTAAHVAMRSGKTVDLITSNGQHLSGTTLGMNRYVDAGLIKITNPPPDLPFASLGTSSGLRPGMWCLAMGHPGGLEVGRPPVLRAGRIIGIRDDSLITDCALISGDSGGPLFDVNGRLIAIHSRIGNDVADNIHIPIDHYDTSWDRMARSESWGTLPGFTPVIGVTRKEGATTAEVGEIAADSPAEQAKMKVGDVIYQFNDSPITTFESLKAAVENTMPGERVFIFVRRGGQNLQLTLTIGRSTKE
jgi:S1-C subfamily serine protease